jgi:hypothetical protein
MKQAAKTDSSHSSNTAAPACSRPARQTVASGSHLAQLAATVNGGPRVRALSQLRDEIQQGSRLQSLMGQAANINPGTPAQLRGVPMNDDANLEREADVMGAKARAASPVPAQLQDSVAPPQDRTNAVHNHRLVTEVSQHVSSVAPIQCKLPSLLEFLHYVSMEEGQQGALERIGVFLGQYLVEKEKRQPDIQVMFAYIDFLDKSINKWFDLYKGPDMKNVPNGPYLLNLHEEVAKEHVLLVDVAYKNPNAVIPVNLATLSEEEQLAVHTIWKSIVSGSGNISVVGASEFQKKMYANLAKLLQGSYGRAMIAYLDGGEVKTANRTTIGSDFGSTFAHHGKEDTEEGSYAFPRANLRNSDDTSSDVIVETTDKHYPVAVTRDDITRLMMAGRPGVNHKGVSYTFGKGGGSLVKIVEEGGESLVDKQLNQILTPSYLTLGHELGHAVRNRGGASFAHAGTETFDKLQLEEEGEKSAQAGALWTSSEEIINITSSENRLRKEHLLTERNYHATQKVATGMKFQQALNALLNKAPEPKYITCSDAWQNQIAPVINDPAWTPEKLETRLQLLPAIEHNVLPVARKKYAIEKQLTDLRIKHAGLISRENFEKIREVQQVLLNLRTENWDEEDCQQKVDLVTKMMEDKAWWRNVKVGGAILGTLATLGIGVYLKYFKGK